MICEAARLARSGASGASSASATRTNSTLTMNSRSIRAASSLVTADRISAISGLRSPRLSHTDSSSATMRSPIRSAAEGSLEREGGAPVHRPEGSGEPQGGAGVLVTTHSMGEAEQCDRLVVMAAGRVVASGTVGEIIGGATTVAVHGGTAGWEDAFAACEPAGLPVALVGTDLRVPAADPRRVRSALESAGVHAEVTVTGATLEEAFVLLAGQAAA